MWKRNYLPGKRATLENLLFLDKIYRINKDYVETRSCLPLVFISWLSYGFISF